MLKKYSENWCSHTDHNTKTTRIKFFITKSYLEIVSEFQGYFIQIRTSTFQQNTSSISCTFADWIQVCTWVRSGLHRSQTPRRLSHGGGNNVNESGKTAYFDVLEWWTWQIWKIKNNREQITPTKFFVRVIYCSHFRNERWKFEQIFF